MASRRRLISTSASPAKDLTLEEAALIAGILQGNVRQSPYVNMEAALRRRNYTLDRMAEVEVHHAAAGRRGEEEARRHARRSGDAVADDRPVLPRGSAQGARRALRRQAALRERPDDSDGAGSSSAGRLQPRARYGTPPHRPPARLPQGAAQRDRRAAHDRGFKHPRWDRPFAVNDIVPAVVVDIGTTAPSTCAPATSRSRSTRRATRGPGRPPRAARDTRRSRRSQAR